MHRLPSILCLCSVQARWTPPSDDATSLQKRLDAAILAGETSIAIEMGTYEFNSASFNVTGASSLRIHAAGPGSGEVALRFGLGAGVVIRNCSDVKVEGPMTIDYTEPTYSQSTIVALGDGCFTTTTPPQWCDIRVRIDDGFPAPDPTLREDFCTFPDCETKMVFFDPSSTLMRQPQLTTWMYNSSLVDPSGFASGAPDYVLRTQQLWEHNLDIGDKVAVASRGCGPCTYQVLFSTHVVTQDVGIFGSCNMAIWELGGGGGHVYRRVRITRPPGPDGERRLLASNFDGIHSEGTLLGPIIEDSLVEHVGDDFFNVQNSIDVVLGVDKGQDAVVVADMSFGSTFPVERGRQVRFFSPTADLWKSLPVGNAAIVQSTELRGEAAEPWLPLLNDLSQELQRRYGWSLAGFLSKSFAIWALHLDRLPSDPAAVGYTALAQVNSSYGAVLRRNTFSDGLSRAGPINSVNAQVYDNTFRNTKLGGLLVSAETTWLSGNLGIDGVTIRNNTFSSCCTYRDVGYPNGQCNESFPIYNPGGSGIDVEGNIVLDAAHHQLSV